VPLLSHSARMAKSRTSGVVAVVLLAAGCAACSASSSPAAKASSSSPAASASASTDPQTAAIMADVNGLIKAETTMFDTATPDNSIYTYAAGAAATYLLNAVEADRSHGIEFTGTPVLRQVQPPVVSMQTSPPSATLTACLDETNWTTVYISDPSKSAEAPGSKPSSHPLSLKLEKQSAGWRVTDYSVNGNATC
jgi:hypothetical protein